MGVAADRGYYYRGALRGGRELSKTLSSASSDSPCGCFLEKGREEVCGEVVCFLSLGYRGELFDMHRAETLFPAV